MFCLDRINLHQIKINILRQALFISIVSCMISSYAAAQKQRIYEEKIVGTWIERGSENGNTKWIFKADKTAEHYLRGKLFTRYQKYEIVRTSEECGHTTFDESIYILQMEENTATSEQDYKIDNVGSVYYHCAYINGIEEELMSLNTTGRGGPPLVLIRQRSPTPNRN